MARRSHAALLTLALLLAASGPSCAQVWHPVPLASPNALCLDGSRGAYHVKPGVGANASKFVLFFQGGGWAMSPQDLLYRSTTQLGSTARDATLPPIDWGSEDLLTNDTARNPHFATWSSVGLRYCCGSSFSSHVEQQQQQQQEQGGGALQARRSCTRGGRMCSLLPWTSCWALRRGGGCPRSPLPARWW